MANPITRDLTLHGFTMGNYTHHFPAFAAQMGAWLAAGDIVFDETVVDDLDHTVDAFPPMLAGANTARMMVRL